VWTGAALVITKSTHPVGRFARVSLEEHQLSEPQLVVLVETCSFDPLLEKAGALQEV
jgi:hypothetical protein